MLKNIKISYNVHFSIINISMTLSVFPSGFYDNGLIEQLRVSILD